MRAAAPLFFVIALLCSCSESVQTTEKASEAEKSTLDNTSDEVEAKQKSIEQAADAAAKLVEQEAREEIEQMKTEPAE